MSVERTGPRRVDLHIGLMKSGTTFVQQLLTQHRERLAADGVLFPGADYARQVAGIRDVIDLRGPLTGAELDGAWDALRAPIVGWPHRAAIISVEHLSLARSTQIRTIVDALQPAEVRVVITARDMARVLPSSWQETVQNGLTWTWEEFVASIVGAPAAMNAPAKRFWRQHGLLDIVDRWSRVLGSDRVHVVTVPRQGTAPEVLWERFCGAVDLDPGRYPVTGSERLVNASLDRDAAELLRRLNERLGDRLDQSEYVRVVKRPLAKRALTQLGAGRPITLPPEQLAWAVRHGEHVVAGLEKRDVPITGDLRELVPAGPLADGSPDGPRTAADGWGDGASTRSDHEESRRIADLATVVAHALIKELLAAGRPAGAPERPPTPSTQEVDA